MTQVIIMRGAPGSGKSTYVQQSFPQAVVCSADFYHIDKEGNYNWKPENIGRAHQSCKDAFELALSNNEEIVVVDNTNTKIKEFKHYYNRAKEYGCEVFVVRLEAPLERLYGNNVHNVPDENVKVMHERMQPFDGEVVVKSFLG